MTKKVNNNQESSSKMKEWVEKTKKRFTVDWFEDEDKQKNRKHYVMTKKVNEQQKPTLKEEMRPLRKMMPWLTIEVSEDEDEQKQ